jgi:arabinogalactan endo-1,4-beta-galactosidase
MNRLLFFFLLALLPACTAPSPASPRPIGVDPNYALDMSSRHRAWRSPSGPADPFSLLAQNGANAARIRLWVGDTGTNQLAYATQTALRAQHAGLKPYLVLFLSDSWSDLVKQPAPAIWQNLPLSQKLAAIEAYAESVTRHFATAGIPLDTFEIGNEIDFGICGIFEEQWPHRGSIDYMRATIWPQMVPILSAAQSGVRKAQPNARFILHLSQWNNPDYCLAFWQYMQSAGVQLDTPGLSYFPTSSDQFDQRPLSYLRAQAAKISATLHKPVLICETAFPATPDFPGQFSTWNHPVDGYPMTDFGQAKWLADFLSLVRSDPNFAGAYYWSPEWYDSDLWSAFALFDSAGNARPALRSFIELPAPTDTPTPLPPPNLSPDPTLPQTLRPRKS